MRPPRAPGQQPDPPVPRWPAPDRRGPGPTSAGVLPSRTTAIQVPSGKPLARIALHGALAASTILLVVLAAIGAG